MATAYKDKLTKSYIDLLEKGFQASILTDTSKALEFLNSLLDLIHIMNKNFNTIYTF